MEDFLFLKDKHLQLLDKYPKIASAVNVTSTHVEIMTYLYDDAINKMRLGGISWYKFMNEYYISDLKKSQSLDKVSLSLQQDIKAIRESLDIKHHFAMITIGWNEQTITPQKMLNVSQKVLSLKYFTTAKMVLEKFRQNGIHHHTHFLVEFDSEYPMSKVIGWIYQTRGVKELCLSKSFIDYLGPKNRKKFYASYQQYDNYIRGIKQESKIPYIEQDRLWRLDNSIPDLIEK